MRKFTTTLMMLTAFAYGAVAQFFDYSKLNQTYTPLSGATEIYKDSVWEDPDFFDILSNPALHMPLGFEFQHNGFTLDSIAIYFDGIVFLTDSVGEAITYEGDGFSVTANPNIVMVPTSLDIVDRQISNSGFSKISYMTEGNAGSRIFKIEYDQVGLHREYDSLKTNTSFMSFQIWIHEGTNIIEYHYGPQNISDDFFVKENTVALAVAVPLIDSLLTGITLSGGPGNEMADYVNNTNLEVISNDYSGVAGDGVVYRFAPQQNVSVKEKSAKSNWSLYPNPVQRGKDVMLMTSPDAETYVLLDILGKVRAQGKVVEGKISLGELPRGQYIMMIQGEQSSISRKLIVH